MDPLWNWSFPLFRFTGVPIRCHWTLPLIGLFDLLLFIQNGWPLWLAPIMVALLFVSVLLHEGGHALATSRVGGRCDSIMLWALGGWAQCHIPMRPWSHFLVAVMGPLVNIGIWAIAVAVVQFQPNIGNHVALGATLAYLAFVNGRMALFNLIPAYPLDGGRATVSFLWGIVGARRGARWAFPIGYVGCALVAVYGFQRVDFFLIMFAIWLVITNYREQQQFRQGSPYVLGLDLDMADHRKHGGWWDRWQQRRLVATQEKVAKEQEAESVTLDRLLDKVSNQGLPSLTAQERSELERISKRQRQRDGG